MKGILLPLIFLVCCTSHEETYTKYITCGALKHGELFQEYHPYYSYFDLDQAICCAREVNRPILVIFTSWASVNCRKFEHEVLHLPEVMDFMRQHYVVVTLYVDDKNRLPSGEFIGTANSQLQIELFRTGSQPYIGMINSDRKIIMNGINGTFDPDLFLEDLETGRRQYAIINE